MHVANTTLFAPYRIYKGKHIFVKKKKIGSQLVISLLCFWILSLYIHEFIEGTTRMACDHLNPCHENVDWHFSYPLIWKCVHTLSYVIHTVTSWTCCFWQLGCRCEYVSFHRLSFFPSCEAPYIYLYTVRANMVPFTLTKPVIIVHPVNFTPLYFVKCFLSFIDPSVMFTH